MKPSDCFGYSLIPEYTTINGKLVKLAREECNILWKMECRNAHDAKAACGFFKTRQQFASDRAEAERVLNKRRKENDVGGKEKGPGPKGKEHRAKE